MLQSAVHAAECCLSATFTRKEASTKTTNILGHMSNFNSLICRLVVCVTVHLTDFWRFNIVQNVDGNTNTNISDGKCVPAS